MTRAFAVVGLLVLLPSAAVANPRGERPMLLEVGFNTRHFSAAEGQQVALRTIGDPDPSFAAGSAVSTSLRFTGATRHDTFVGVEAETGMLVGLPGSNLAGAYGVAGARGSLGRARLTAELVGGHRWVRYALDGREDVSKWIAEPRVRADVFVGSQLTLGGAIGATLGDHRVWMAGIYLGLHSKALGRLD